MKILTVFLLAAVLALGLWLWSGKRDREKVEAFIANYPWLVSERTNDSWLAYHNWDACLLSQAAYTGDTIIAKILLAHNTNVNTGCYFDSPLHLAARCGHADMVKLLLAHKAKADVRNNNGQSPLDVAGNRAVAELLLTDNTDTHRRGCALYSAAKNGHKDVVEFLLNKQVPVSADILDAAAFGGHKDIMELLIAHGAVVTREALNNAIFGCYTDVPKMDKNSATLADHKEVIQFLLANKVEVNITNCSCLTPLHRAVGSGQKWIVDLLLANKAEVNVRDCYGDTPLKMAAYGGYKDIVECLLNNHADVNAMNNKGETPLAEAVKSPISNKETIELLRQHGGK